MDRTVRLVLGRLDLAAAKRAHSQVTAPGSTIGTFDLHRLLVVEATQSIAVADHLGDFSRRVSSISGF